MKAIALALLSGCFLFRGGEGPGCPTDRTVSLGLQEDVTAFTGCKHASSVLIRTGATIDVTPLHDLEDITGDLVIGPTVGIDEISFHGLVKVGGTIHVSSNGSLRGLFLPALEQAGRIEIDGNWELATIALPRLAAVAGAMVITDNHDLELIEASALVTVGKELVISEHPQLTLVELGHFASAETVRIENAPKLPPEVGEQLRAKTRTR